MTDDELCCHLRLIADNMVEACDTTDYTFVYEAAERIADLSQRLA